MLNISSAGFTSSVNLGTEGVLDWIGIASDPSSGVPRSVLVNEHHKRMGGGMMFNFFDWIAGTGSPTAFSQAGSITTTAAKSEDANAGGAALTGSTTGYGYNSASATGYGFRMLVPATPQPRILRVYESHFSSILTVAAAVMDGVGDPVAVTTTNDAGSGATTHRKWSIEFSAVSEAWLAISFLITTIDSGTANLKFYGATLAKS